MGTPKVVDELVLKYLSKRIRVKTRKGIDLYAKSILHLYLVDDRSSCWIASYYSLNSATCTQIISREFVKYMTANFQGVSYFPDGFKPLTPKAFEKSKNQQVERRYS